MSLRERISACLGRDLLAVTECRGDLIVEVGKGRIRQVLEKLRDDPALGMDFLSDVIGVDNSTFELKKKKPKKKAEGEEEKAVEEEPKGPPPPRYEVVYLLLSLERNERVMVKVKVPEDDMEVPSVVSLWKAATWPEREAWDMFGIRFSGHPDLRRLLMWDGFPAHPLRKDYPLEGRGEERHLLYES